MADVTKIGIEVESTPANNQNIKSLKAQLREAVMEAQMLSQQDLGSAQAIAAQKRVAELRDQIDDTNDAIQSFTGAGQFQAFGKAVQGVAGGFAAAQGAMALFGNESEDLQKILLKVNAAMALTQGLAALEDAPRAFMQIRTMIVTQVIPALGTLRGALIATGVGAAAVAVGLLVANWEKVVKIVREFIGLGPTQTEIIQQQTKALETQNKLFDLNADKYDEFTQRKIKANLEYKKSVLDNATAVKDGLMTEQEAIALNRVAREKANREIAKADEDRFKATLEYNKKRAEEEKRRAEERKKRDEERLKKFVEQMDMELKQIENQRYANEQLDILTKDMERKEFESAQASFDNLQANTKASEDAANKKRELKLQELDNERAVADSIIGLSANVAQAIGANAEVEKKIATASTLIQTIQATQTSFLQAQKNPTTIAFPAYPYIVAAATIAAGLARVRAINSVNTRGGGSAGTVSTPAPPTISAPQGTNVQGAGDVQLPSQPTNNRVYVVESDIRGTMNRVDVIERNRTIG